MALIDTILNLAVTNLPAYGSRSQEFVVMLRTSNFSARGTGMCNSPNRFHVRDSGELLPVLVLPTMAVAASTENTAARECHSLFGKGLRMIADSPSFKQLRSSWQCFD